jgi:hypothetical protein
MVGEIVNLGVVTALSSIAMSRSLVNGHGHIEYRRRQAETVKGIIE